MRFAPEPLRSAASRGAKIASLRSAVGTFVENVSGLRDLEEALKRQWEQIREIPGVEFAHLPTQRKLIR